jgi:hypothetical protein
MHLSAIFRCVVLLIAVLPAACGSDEPPVSAEMQTLDFSYLTPLPLNVANVVIQSEYVPSGMPPDVSQFDPIPPVQALRLMAEQRLKAAGGTGEAVFVINDASMVRNGNAINGVMSVTLSIYPSGPVRAGVAQATITQQAVGGGDLPRVLADLTRRMMDQMNVEFEFQVRRSLRDFLLSASANPSPVQQSPLSPAGSPSQAYPLGPAARVPEPLAAPPPTSPPPPYPLPPAETLPEPSGMPPPLPQPLPYQLPPAGPVTE